MRTTTGRALVAVVAVLLAALGAWLFYARERTESPGTTPDPRAPVASARRGATAPDGDPLPGLGDDLDADEHDQRSSAPTPAERGGASVQRIPPSTRPFASPAAASAFIEARVLELFAAVSPQLDPKTISKTCEPDGRICTFEGPWPGDDFLKNWIRAISAGKTGPEALDGVMFSEFRPYGEDGDKRFVVVAHAP